MRAFKGICLGLLLNFPYGLISGFFILSFLGLASSSFLPGVPRMMDSSFGPMVSMVITWLVGILVFPAAGAIWFTQELRNRTRHDLSLPLFVATALMKNNKKF